MKRIPSWVFAAIPVAATFLVWFGATRSGFTPDDYLVINVQSPIRTFIDVISMFWRQDPNPQYWRPLADSSVSFDFWLWGWNGGMFHLTNLLLHCIAVGLIYVFVRRMFSFSAFAAGILALFFGVSGSHDSNLLWIAARADVIAMIMMLIVLLSAYKAASMQKGKWLWLIISFIGYFFALSAKEVSVVIIVLLPLLVYSASGKEVWQKKWHILGQISPYIVITAIFIVIRLQFTVPFSEMQPLTAEGSHSIIAFAKNFLYSIGYAIAPVDFRMASIIVNRYAAIGYAAAIMLFTGVILLMKISGAKKTAVRLYKPLILTLVTGLVSFQSFERWRIYFPSVGIFAILIILFASFWNIERRRLLMRGALVVLAISVGVFHIHQAVRSQHLWEKATAALPAYKRDLQKILALHKQRPITLELITSPTKYGSAPLIQLSKTFLAKYAEADLLNSPGLQYGAVSIPGDSITIETDLDLYALEPEKGFRSLEFKKIGDREYEISGIKDEIGLFPNAEFKGGKARRDMKLESGEKMETFGSEVTIIDAESSFASHVRLKITDTSSVHLYYNGEHLVELR
ncbi:MAG: ArnT family glycosyltransferase [Candidatus Kapaibacterium sp.]